MQLYGDEPTYYAMASSLVHDGDLRCGATDVARLFERFPFASGIHLDLTRSEDGSEAFFANPILYPLFATPFTALWDARGPGILNAICFVLTLFLAWRWLRRHNTASDAFLFAAGFLVLAAPFVYLYLMQAQILVMLLVASSFFLVWPSDKEGAIAPWQACISGAALGLATHQQLSLLLLAWPLLVVLRSRKAAAVWLTSAALALGGITLLASSWTETPASEVLLGNSRQSYPVENPLETPWSPSYESSNREAQVSSTLHALPRDLGNFLWGRRAGLLPYFPFVLTIALLFARARARSRKQWILLAALIALAFLQIVAEPISESQVHATIGNPHVVMIYPLLLLFVTQLPGLAIVGSYLVGAVLISTLLLTPFGSVTPDVSTQAHTRAFPFDRLPLEPSTILGGQDFLQLPLYGFEQPVVLHVPKGRGKIFEDEVWVFGGDPAELWLESPVELPAVNMHLRNIAPSNFVTVRLGRATEERLIEETPPRGLEFRLHIDPRRPNHTMRQASGDSYLYRLLVETERGAKPQWINSPGNTYLGIALSFLGTDAHLQRDVYAVEWLGCGAPSSIEAGETAAAAVRLRNTSSSTWSARGPARVRLSYRWRDAEGRQVGGDGRRTDLKSDIAPAATVDAWMAIDAPSTPGRYTLDFEPIFEHVSWFSDRSNNTTCRATVEVRDDSEPAPEATSGSRP